MHIARILLALTVAVALPATATDLAITLGAQGNGDFQLSETAPPELGAPGDSVTVDTSASAGLILDWVFQKDDTKRIGAFLTHSRTSFDQRAGLADRDMGVTHLHFNGTSYYPNGQYAPFVTAGLGLAHFSPGERSLDSTTRFSFNIGAGGVYTLSERWSVRFEARWIATVFNGSSAAICNGGCVIAVKSDLYSQFQASAGVSLKL